MIHRISFAPLLLAAALGFAVEAAAEGPADSMVETGPLGRAFASAQGNDPQYRAARHELDAATYVVPLARAGLLPSLSLSVGRSSSKGSREQPGLLGGTVRQDLDYRSPVSQLNLRVPLLNFEAIARYRQSKFQLAQAEAEFESNRLQLADRLATAYFQRLLADESADLAMAQLSAALEQSRLSQRRFAAGEGTRVDVAEAEASQHLAEAQLIEAHDQLLIAQRALDNITGSTGLPLVGPGVDFRPPATLTGNLEHWLGTAATNSPNLQARQHALRVAEMEITRARSGHAPRVDLVASVSRSENESISTLDQQTELRTIGVQLSLPLYSGGSVNAATGQAVALRGKAMADMDAALASVQLEIERQFRAVASGAERVLAYANAMGSSEIALRGKQRQMVSGLATTADVLAAMGQLFVAKRDLAQARFEYLLARLRLQATAGASSGEIIADLDQFLTAPR